MINAAGRGPELPLPALIGATLALALGFVHLVDVKPWPSSDLEGHIATIDLYRQSIANGVLWPYDPRSALGFDGTPYYSWCFELLLGAIALLLGACGVAQAAAATAIGTIVLSCCLRLSCIGPLTWAWVSFLFYNTSSRDSLRFCGKTGGCASFISPPILTMPFFLLAA